MSRPAQTPLLRRYLGPIVLLLCAVLTALLIDVGLRGESPHWLVVISALL